MVVVLVSTTVIIWYTNLDGPFFTAYSSSSYSKHHSVDSFYFKVMKLFEPWKHANDIGKDVDSSDSMLNHAEGMVTFWSDGN